jgi:hypothetical protein
MSTMESQDFYIPGGLMRAHAVYLRVSGFSGKWPLHPKKYGSERREERNQLGMVN